MSIRKVRLGGMLALVATLVILAPLALVPSALGSNAGSEYHALLATHPDWMKRHGLSRPPVTPYNPRQSGRAP
jgi:hypothetical protein